MDYDVPVTRDAERRWHWEILWAFPKPTGARRVREPIAPSQGMRWSAAASIQPNLLANMTGNASESLEWNQGSLSAPSPKPGFSGGTTGPDWACGFVCSCRSAPLIIAGPQRWAT